MTVKLRYLLVGGICALMHNAIMIAGDLAGLHYVVSTIISFSIVTVTGYALHLKFTFRETAHRSSLGRYMLGMTVNFPVSLAGMFLLVDLLGLPVFIAAPLITAALVVWNFVTSRWAIVRGAA